MVQVDRRAKTNRFERGIAPEEQHKSVGLTQGVPMDSYWGQSKDLGLPATPGIPHVGQGTVTRQEATCGASNKQGEPCKAKPVKGDNFCVGHRRQKDAEIRNSSTS